MQSGPARSSTAGSHRLFADIVIGTPTLATPDFLAKVAPGARVHASFASVSCGGVNRAAALSSFDQLSVALKNGFMQSLSSLLDSRDNADSILGALDSLLHGQEPRSVLLAGYCIGGSLATLAAPWAALHWPSADVRCITVGSPKLGNKEFAEAYSWLVGLSYRGVYRLDPMPGGWMHAGCGRCDCGVRRGPCSGGRRARHQPGSPRNRALQMAPTPA